jgi:hypothetical protein
MCKQRSPDPRELLIDRNSVQESLSRNTPCPRIIYGAGFAMVFVGVERCLGEHGVRSGTLKNERGAILLMADQVDRAGSDKVDDAHRIAQVKYSLARLEGEFPPREISEEVLYVGKHDLYHVL